MQPFRKKCWVIPAKQNAAFIHKMEQVLTVYERAYDAKKPVICLDESTKQLIESKCFIGSDGITYRDSEYIRHGVRAIYMSFEPLAGRRECFVEENPGADLCRRGPTVLPGLK